MSTVETCMKEPAAIGTLRLKSHLLSPLSKNLKEAEMEIGSYIVGFILCDIELQKYKLSLTPCVLNTFLQKIQCHTVVFKCTVHI